MALDRNNKEISYLTGRMIAILEHYASDDFGPNTLDNLFTHPLNGLSVFEKYVDREDVYYRELKQVDFPVTVHKATEKGVMWIGFYHQKSEYNSAFIKKSIRERIICRLKELKMTQKSVAEKAGITPQELNAYIKGRQAISLDKLELLFRILGI